MSDKILTESLAAIRAIEESDDPFCIGATGDTDHEQGYKPINEESDEKVCSHCGEAGGMIYTPKDGNHCTLCAKSEDKKEVEESVDDWAQPKEYEYEDNSGHLYAITYQDDNGAEVGILEVNGVTAAHWKVGGAGPTDGQIVKPELVLLAIESILSNS